MAIFKRPFFNPEASRKKREMPEGLWIKCPNCGETIHTLELAKQLGVCPHCDHHLSQTARERIESLLDPGSFEERDANLVSVDALGFSGPSSYSARLESYRKRTGLNEAVVSGHGTIEAQRVAISVMDFQFLAASMGSVVGEKITRNIEYATQEGIPLIIISASGGARMHEGMLGLMQMAKTSGALARHAAAGLPYLSVLTNPTTGGVTASFATLGDVIVAEPKAMIGFAGPRVIKETTHQNLPPGFQTAEFLRDHGLVDLIVHRHQLRQQLGLLLQYLTPRKAV